MMISTRGRYALCVMIALADNPSGDYVPLKTISDKEGISKEYLNSILKVLVEHGLLDSLRGKGGGYRLACLPNEYSVGQILRLVEGDLAPVPCVTAQGACSNAANCPSMPMWRQLDHMINDFFDRITLEELLEQDSTSPGTQPLAAP